MSSLAVWRCVTRDVVVGDLGAVRSCWSLRARRAGGFRVELGLVPDLLDGVGGLVAGVVHHGVVGAGVALEEG